MRGRDFLRADRKSTRLNSSHQIISYAVFCLKKKKIESLHFFLLKKKKKSKCNFFLCFLCYFIYSYFFFNLCKITIQFFFYFFFFNDTATTEIYTLSLHDALPIFWQAQTGQQCARVVKPQTEIQ